MKNLFCSIAAVTFLLFSSFSFAGVIGGGSYGAFYNPTLQDNTWHSDLGYSHISYGKGPYGRNSQSSLWYEGYDLEIEEPSEYFKVGSLGFFNGSSYVGTSIDAIDLELYIDFGGYGSEEITFDLNTDQTLNSLDPADDFLYLPEAYTSEKIYEIDGSEYLLTLFFGEYLDGEYVEIDHLQVAEKHYDNVYLYGSFTQVPVPAAFWLFGSAIATLLVTRRKVTA